MDNLFDGFARLFEVHQEMSKIAGSGIEPTTIKNIYPLLCDTKSVLNADYENEDHGGVYASVFRLKHFAHYHGIKFDIPVDAEIRSSCNYAKFDSSPHQLSNAAVDLDTLLRFMYLARVKVQPQSVAKTFLFEAFQEIDERLLNRAFDLRGSKGDADNNVKEDKK